MRQQRSSREIIGGLALKEAEAIVDSESIPCGALDSTPASHFQKKAAPQAAEFR
jgi:hypothetical protein